MRKDDQDHQKSFDIIPIDTALFFQKIHCFSTPVNILLQLDYMNHKNAFISFTYHTHILIIFSSVLVCKWHIIHFCSVILFSFIITRRVRFVNEIQNGTKSQNTYSFFLTTAEICAILCLVRQRTLVLTTQIQCIADFFQKRFLEMPL